NTALLKQLVDFCIRRDFPHLQGDGEALYAAWFDEVCARTAMMMGHWMRVGFVHGVMNTDNMSILGLTIDYGPYGWIDNYDPDWTPNTTDRQNRRYRFGQQPAVAYWNLGRLAGALSPLFDGVEPLQAGLQQFVDTYAAADRDNTARKLGLAECRDDDLALMQDLQDLLREAEVDMTLFFRSLVDFGPTTGPESEAGPSSESGPIPRGLVMFADAFYDDAKRDAATPAFNDWLDRYAARLRDDPLGHGERRERMHNANPRYVLRNYLAQQAIDRAEQGDTSGVVELLDVMRRPYEDQP